MKSRIPQTGTTCLPYTLHSCQTRPKQGLAIMDDRAAYFHTLVPTPGAQSRRRRQAGRLVNASTPSRAPRYGWLAVEPQSEGRLRRGFGEPVLIAETPDGGSGGEEFGRVLAPDVIVDRDVHPDDARGPGLHCFRLHPGQRELAGLVDALGEDHHFLILACLAQ